MSIDTDITLAPRSSGVLERDACRLYYEVCGSGPAIVFAHGLGGNHLSWWQQIAHFSQRFTCVSFAHRGFAPSSSLQGGPDPRDFATDLAALIEHLGLDDLRIVAQSMGGWSAVDYAIAHPGRLRGLVLSATTGTLDWQPANDAERARLATWAAEGTTQRQRFKTLGIHPAAGARMAREQPAMHLLYRQIDDLSRGLDKESLRARLSQCRTRPPADLAKAGCPVLFICPDEDLVIPPFAGEAIARGLPAARAARIEQAGHSAYFERPAVFNRLVDDFLRGLPA